MTIQTVQFQSAGIDLVGQLYLPDNFSETQRYKTIVVTPPAHQIKEQTAAVYGPLLAQQGFIFLAFVTPVRVSRKGMRNDEHAFRKQEYLRNAISFLCNLPCVDQTQLFGVGICGGGTIMSSVLITDLRVKAFASISAMLATDALCFAADNALSYPPVPDNLPAQAARHEDRYRPVDPITAVHRFWIRSAFRLNQADNSLLSSGTNLHRYIPGCRRCVSSRAYKPSSLSSGHR